MSNAAGSRGAGVGGWCDVFDESLLVLSKSGLEGSYVKQKTAICLKENF